jgi:hypothetical protein
MTIQEKINKKGFNLVASYNNGKRVGYFATSRLYNEKARTYKTQTEVLNALKHK